MDIDSLEKEVKKSQWFLAAILLFICFIYGVWFFFINDQSLSSSSSDWGSFGDFVGGIINPLVAFFAFCWLTKSVLIQKRELSESRAALEKSNLAQERQAKIALKTVKLNTLNIELNMINSQINNIIARRNSILDQAHDNNGMSKVLNNKCERVSPQGLIAEINSEIETLETHHRMILAKIRNFETET